jgi:hypothetical protein
MDISAIGRQFGLDEAQTRAALEALTPVVAAGVRRNAQTPDGLKDILRGVLMGGHTAALDDEGAVTYDRAKPQGDEILGQIFKSKDVSREVAQQLSATSGIGAALLKKLLPIVASIVMAQLTKKMSGGGTGGGGLGDILGDVLGGGSRAPQGGSGGGLGDILKDVLGGGASAPAPRQAPVDRDQSRSPSLEDILGDILGGGSAPQEQAPSGGTRGRTRIDDILGGGSRGGNAAEDLLNSVEDALRRR